MGLLVDGVWKTDWYDTESSGGEFIRGETQFRHRIGENSGFDVEAERYHLYVSLACPWAMRWAQHSRTTQAKPGHGLPL